MKKKFLVIISLICFCFILASCSLQSEDTMTIAENFSGSRVISLKLEKKDAHLIKGGLEGLSDFLKSQVIDPLEVNVSSPTKDKLEAQIILRFDGLDDYIKKVTYLYELSGNDQKPATKFNSSNRNIFTKGLDFYDDVNSEKLLAYLLNKGIEDGIIEEKNRDKIFSSPSYSLVYKGDRILTKSGKGPYQIKNFEYLGPSTYLMSTSMQDTRTWTRVFSLVFPAGVYEKIDFDWKTTLVKDPKIFDLGPKNTEDSSGRSQVIYKFALENASLDEIAEASSDFLQAKDLVDLSLEKNTETFSIDYKIKEKLENFDDANDLSLVSIYYTRPKTRDLHYPVSGDYQKELSESKDIIVLQKDDLLKAYDNTIKIQPKFEKADIETKINLDLSLEKEIKIFKGTDFYANMGSDLLSEYLTKYDIQTSDDSREIIVRYGGQDFEKKNLLFFDKNPEISITESGLFGYVIDYKDSSKLNKFTLDEVKQNFLGPSLSKVSKKKLSFSENTFDNEIAVKGTSTANILFFSFIALLLIGLGIYIYVKKRKDKKLKEEFYDDPKPSEEKDPRQTQPIPVINNLDLLDEDKKTINNKEGDKND